MSEKCIDIPAENFFEVVIVGGGTCGLAVASRLCEDAPGLIYTEDEHQRFHWLKERGNRVSTFHKGMGKKSSYVLPSKLTSKNIVVLDALADTFLGGWDLQFRLCQIPYLRLPMFFHPDPVNVDGMVTYAHQHHREKELMEIANVVGKEYLKHQMKRTMKKKKKSARQPAPENVGDNKAGQPHHHDRSGIVDVNMRDWKDYYRPSTNFFRDFCQDIIDRYDLAGSVRKDEVVAIRYRDMFVVEWGCVERGMVVETLSGQVYGARACVVALGHRGRRNYPIKGLSHVEPLLERSCHTTDIFSGAVAFPHPRMVEKVGRGVKPHLVVVGGGLCSAQLAHVACTMGIQVTLLMRGPVKIKHFDFHLDWVTKYKNVKKSAFYMLDTDEERAQLIHEAREGGLINPEYHHKLNKHQAAGRLTLRRYTTLEHADWDAGSMQWEVRLCGAKSGAKGGIHSGEDESGAPLEETTVKADYICCATGIQADLASLGFMQDMMKEYPIDSVGGFPCLLDDLQWSADVPLFMVGKNASLKIGPTAANLDGARVCAERVGWKIQEDLLGSTSTVADKRLQLAGNNLNWYTLLEAA